MKENLVDASGVDGSTTSVTIYTTEEYYPRRSGASVAHGQTTDGGRHLHVEFVDVEMPGITLRVRADDVRAELGALYAATERWQDSVAEVPDEDRSRQHAAFDALRAAVWGIVGPLVEVRHIDAVARQAYEEGARDGRGSLQSDLRALLGVGEA